MGRTSKVYSHELAETMINVQLWNRHPFLSLDNWKIECDDLNISFIFTPFAISVKCVAGTSQFLAKSRESLLVVPRSIARHRPLRGCVPQQHGAWLHSLFRP